MSEAELTDAERALAREWAGKAPPLTPEQARRIEQVLAPRQPQAGAA